MKNHLKNFLISILKRNKNLTRWLIKFFLELERVADNYAAILSKIYYDGVPPKHFMLKDHHDFIIENIGEDEIVLDIGCGNGAFTQTAAKKAREVIAIDTNPERIEEAKTLHNAPNIRYLCMDCTKELPNGVFDVVILSHVLEHLENPCELLKILVTNTERLIIKVPRIDRTWEKMVREDLGMYYFDDSTHHREYTLEMLEKELVQSGWKIRHHVISTDLRAIAVKRDV